MSETTPEWADLEQLCERQGVRFPIAGWTMRLTFRDGSWCIGDVYRRDGLWWVVDRRVGDAELVEVAHADAEPWLS